MTLRDFLFCLFQDLLRFTAIDFVKVLVPYTKITRFSEGRI